MIKIFSATQTLKGYNEQLNYTVNKEDADLLIIGGKPIDLNEYPKLKGIFKTGVGLDNLPFEEAKKRNIEVELPSEKTKQIIYNETALYTFHLILNFIYQKKGEFETWDKFRRKSIGEYQILVMGCGNIGSKLVEWLSPIFRVECYDPKQKHRLDLDDLLQTSDIISLHMPLLPSTRNFFDKKKLSLLKSGSLLINTARGQIIDEIALYEELKNKRINASIDVFWEEPYHGILTQIKSDNVHLSPHIASTCSNFFNGLAEDFLKFHTKFI